MKVVAAVCLVLVAAGCGTGPSAVSPDPQDAPAAVRSHGLLLPPVRDPGSYSLSGPPRFHVLTDDGQLDLSPWTICFSFGCADGAPSDTPPPIGSPDALVFGFDVPGWTFDSVTFREHGTRSGCGRSVTVAAETTGERTFRVLLGEVSRTFTLCPILDRVVWPAARARGSHGAEVHHLRRWIDRRMAWMDRRLG